MATAGRSADVLHCWVYSVPQPVLFYSPFLLLKHHFEIVSDIG
jgi:hypothetical protein